MTALPQSFYDAMRKGNHITAIKIYRDITNATLLEAKTFVDRFADKTVTASGAFTMEDFRALEAFGLEPGDDIEITIRSKFRYVDDASGTTHLEDSYLNTESNALRFEEIVSVRVPDPPEPVYTTGNVVKDSTGMVYFRTSSGWRRFGTSYEYDFYAPARPLTLLEAEASG